LAGPLNDDLVEALAHLRDLADPRHPDHREHNAGAIRTVLDAVEGGHWEPRYRWLDDPAGDGRWHIGRRWVGPDRKDPHA
jgi:hypothetical protein